MIDQEPHEHPKPTYSSQFAETPFEAYKRGVDDGIAWVCNEAVRRANPEGYKAEIARNRLQQELAATRAALFRLQEEHRYCHYRDDMGR
jgi:hypothetical protein